MIKRLYLFAVAAVTLTAVCAAEVAPQQTVDIKVRAEARKRVAEGQVCEAMPELGSRLRGHMVCMTKQQWAEQREQDRQLIDRSQLQVCVPGGGNC